MHSPYQNIYWFHEDQEFLHGQYMNSTEFNYKHASKKTGEKKKKRKGSNCHQTPTHFVHSIVCSRRVLCGVIHANNLDATGSGTYGELTYSPDFSLAFAKAIQNYSLGVWAMSLFWGTPWQWWEIIGWVVTLSSLLIDEDPVPVRCKI